MSKIQIPVYRPSLCGKEKIYVQQCLDENWISSKGEFVERFESSFAKYVECNYALSVCNGTVALHVALLALGIGEGDEVLVPSLTYIATANAVRYTGATPVFVDCNRHTWQMDISDTRKAITPRTRAMIPVHLYGQPCDMEALMSISKEFDLLVIEDCAEAIGSKINGKHVGTFGDVATFSFYGNKTITTGEGGMVVTSNANLAERIYHLKSQGLARSREYWHDIIGFNYRMTNICAAIGCAQLEQIDDILGRKLKIARAYQSLLGSEIEFQGEMEETTHSFWMVCILVPNIRQRDPIRDSLASSGIETRPVFYPIHSMPMYAASYRRMPNSDEISRRGINIPSYPDLSNDQIEFIASKIKEFLK